MKTSRRHLASSAPKLPDDDIDDLKGQWLLAWAVECLYHARNHLLHNRDRNLDDITALQVLYSASKRVLDEAHARAEEEREAA